MKRERLMATPVSPSPITRRLALGSLAGLAAASATGAKGEAGDRPNILWLVSEDNNPFVGAYGDRLAHTPTIDALAKKGLLFRNVYSNAPVCAPSRFGILTGVYPESCAPANHMRAIGRIPRGFHTYPELLRSAGYFCTNNAKADYNCDIDAEAIWDIQGSKGHWRARPVQRPFMAVFNYETTHESRLFRPTAGRVTPAMVMVPPYLPDTPGIRQDYASYYNLMERMDGQLAERLAELKADGLEDDTIVFHYSDNGGAMPRSKRYCYDEGHRCELVVYVPPKWQHLMPASPGSEITAPVSFIDLAPTLLSIAGIAQPAQMQGRAFLGQRIASPQQFAFGMRNRMDERIDFIRTLTDGRWRYIRNYMPHRPWGQHQAFAWLAKGYQDWESGWRAGTLNPVQRRFFETKPFEELYDLRADPHQIDNRADDREAAAVLRSLRRVLDRHMLAIHDNGFLPETMAGEGYFESRDNRIYPLKRVMALADHAARRDPARIPELRKQLASDVPVLRYWAATGLLALAGDAAPARLDLERAMRTDPSWPVRIVAAEAAAGLGSGPEPVAMLAGVVDDAPQWQLRLQALNALTFLGDAAKPALPSVQRAAESDQEYVRNAGRYLAAVLTGIYQPQMPIFDVGRMTKRKEGPASDAKG